MVKTVGNGGLSDSHAKTSNVDVLLRVVSDPAQLCFSASTFAITCEKNTNPRWSSTGITAAARTEPCGDSKVVASKKTSCSGISVGHRHVLLLVMVSPILALSGLVCSRIKATT